MLPLSWERAFVLYCVIFGGTFAFVLFRFAFAPQGTEFLGVYLMAVTLPWSLIVTPLLAMATPDAPVFNVLVLLACGIANAILMRRAAVRSKRSGDERSR